MTDLIEAAGRLRDPARREDAARRLSDAVAEEMPLRYAMPFPPEARPPWGGTGTDSRTRRGQWYELMQHLTDLAYVSTGAFQRWHAGRSRKEAPAAELLLEIVAGIEVFVGEDDAAIIRELPPLPGGALAGRLDWVERYLSVLVHRLAQLTSFDGDLPIASDYRVGERGTFGRSLAFRLRVLFYDYRTERRTARRARYLNAAQLPRLVSLTTFLPSAYTAAAPGRADVRLDRSLLALLLDGDALLRAYREGLKRTDGTRGRFYLQYRLGTPTAPKENLSRRAARWVRRNQDHLDTGLNHFGVRLLQLSLWRAGFYTGRPDGDIGPLTHAALTALLEQEREYGSEPRRKLDKVLLATDTPGEWVVDFHRLSGVLSRYTVPDEDEARNEEDAIWERIREADQEATVDRVFAARQAEVAALYGTPQSHPGRRVYYGLRGLIRGAFRAIGRIVKWIAGAVGQLLGAVFDFVKSLAKRVQEGVGLFFAGFRFFAHYLLGRPFLTVAEASAGEAPVLMTRFRVDFDVVNLVNPAAGPDTLRRHTALLRDSREGAVYFLDTVVTCIRVIALLQPPMGWLRLAVHVARVVRSVLDGRERTEEVRVA